MELTNLRTIGLEITNRCNFNCIHCYLPKRNDKVMNIDFIADIIAELGSEFNWFYLTGGEPLIHPDFNKIYQMIRREGFLVNILTNGSVLNDNILGVFKEMMPHKIEISIYGMSDKTYSQVTKFNGYYEIIKDNVIKLRKMTNNILLKYNLLSKNYHDLGKFIEFSKAFNFNYSISSQIIPNLAGDKEPVKYRLSPNKLIKLIKKENLDLKTVYEDMHLCDAGDNIFIDSDNVLHGCPILKTNFDVKINKITGKEQLSRFINNIKDYRMTFSDNICPGWLLLEGNSGVKSYINQISNCLKKR